MHVLMLKDLHVYGFVCRISGFMHVLMLIDLHACVCVGGAASRAGCWSLLTFPVCDWRWQTRFDTFSSVWIVPPTHLSVCICYIYTSLSDRTPLRLPSEPLGGHLCGREVSIIFTVTRALDPTPACTEDAWRLGQRLRGRTAALSEVTKVECVRGPCCTICRCLVAHSSLMSVNDGVTGSRPAGLTC